MARSDGALTQCIVLAGGTATRMRPITEKIPKALIPIDEAQRTPFAHYQLIWLRRQGIREVIYSIGYRGEMIQDFAGDGSRYGLKIHYVADGPTLLGTGGAVRKIHDLGLLSERFFVTYGDSFLPIDHQSVARAFVSSGAPTLMTVIRNEGRWDASNADFRDGRVVRYDKRKDAPGREDLTYIDYGLLAFHRNVIGPNLVESDLAPMLGRFAAEGKLAGFEARERFYEIGSMAGLQDFRQLVAAEPGRFEPE